MRIPILLLVLFVAAQSAAAQPPPPPPLPAPVPGAAQPAYDLAGLRQAERRRAQAVASRDIITLRNLISGDYYHVDTAGRVRSKTEFLRLLSRDEFEFRSYEVLDMEVRIFDNGRTAVVTGRFHADMQQGAVERDFRGRYVRIWVQGPDGWRNTMQQSTEIKTAPAR